MLPAVPSMHRKMQGASTGTAGIQAARRTAEEGVHLPHLWAPGSARQRLHYDVGSGTRLYGDMVRSMRRIHQTEENQEEKE